MPAVRCVEREREKCNHNENRKEVRKEGRDGGSVLLNSEEKMYPFSLSGPAIVKDGDDGLGRATRKCGGAMFIFSRL